MTVDFLEPSRLHASSTNETVADVASDLEKRYHVISKFSKMHKQDIIAILIDFFNNPDDKGICEDKIKNIWRQYIRSEEHGIKTRAAEEEGRQSFIYTSDYFLAMRVKINE